MFFVGILSWWYGSGWRDRFKMMMDRIERTSDYFSIVLLLETLFAPFRQISAGGTGGSLADQARSFLDKTISRCIGALLRIVMIIVGVIIIIFQCIFGLLFIIFWPLVPLLPIAGVILAVIGWIPLWR
jgi:hypothetical protein